MKITLEHLGKTVRYRDCPLSFTIEGFEREGNNLYAYGKGASGSRPSNPQHPAKGYYWINSDEDAEEFRLVEKEHAAALPASIEPLMESFGCHEKQTRALVAAILKEVKENTR